MYLVVDLKVLEKNIAKTVHVMLGTLAQILFASSRRYLYICDKKCKMDNMTQIEKYTLPNHLVPHIYLSLRRLEPNFRR